MKYIHEIIYIFTQKSLYRCTQAEISLKSEKYLSSSLSHNEFGVPRSVWLWTPTELWRRVVVASRCCFCQSSSLIIIRVAWNMIAYLRRRKKLREDAWGRKGSISETNCWVLWVGWLHVSSGLLPREVAECSRCNHCMETRMKRATKRQHFFL